MKKIFNILLVLLSTVLLFSCRNENDIPEDIHEHEEIEKLVVKIVEKNSLAEQTINYIGGVADKPILLENGKTYSVSLDFQVKHGNEFHSAIDEIEEEKDEHFVTYTFAGADVNILRTADDIIRTDGKKLGLKTEWTVNSAPSSAKVNIRLIHGADSVNDQTPSAANQLGSVTGGESDVDALIDIQ